MWAIMYLTIYISQPLISSQKAGTFSYVNFKLVKTYEFAYLYAYINYIVCACEQVFVYAYFWIVLGEPRGDYKAINLQLSQLIPVLSNRVCSIVHLCAWLQVCMV